MPLRSLKACLAVIVAFLFACIPALAQDGPAAAALGWGDPALEGLIQEGWTRNNDILALKSQAESARAAVPLAGSLDDPRLGVGLLNLPTDTFSFDQEAMTQKQIFLAQKFPWPGKRDLRSRKQALAAVRQEALAAAQELLLARQLAAAWYDLGFTVRSLAVNEELTQLLSQLEKVAEARYKTGPGLMQDVLAAQLELSGLMDERITLGARRRALEDRINELLNREPGAEVGTPQVPALPPPLPDEKALEERSLAANPMLAARRAEVEAADAEILLGEKDYWPDPDVTVAYGQRDDAENGTERADFLSATVSISLPVRGKSRQGSRIASARKARDAAESSLKGLQASLPLRVHALAAEIRGQRESCLLVTQGLVAQADQWARSALSAYEVGKVEFATLQNAQTRLVKEKLKADRYLFELAKKRAELCEVLGGPMPGAGEEAPAQPAGAAKETP